MKDGGESLIGRDFFGLFLPEFQETLSRSYADVVEGKIDTVTCIAAYVAGRETKLADICMVPIHHRRKGAVLGIAHDITDRIKVEKNLLQSQEQLRSLLSHQERIIEEERSHISREIHDEFGQVLTYVRIDLIWLKKKLPRSLPVIADDHPLIRKGFKLILAGASDMYTPHEASSGQEVLDRADEKNYDIILLDITFPDMNGLDVLKELKRKHPGVPVLIISLHPEEDYAVSAMKGGASGYLTKGSAPDELLNAIEKVSGGGKWITETLAERLSTYLGHDTTMAPHDSLTTRESQVLCMISLLRMHMLANPYASNNNG